MRQLIAALILIFGIIPDLHADVRDNSSSPKTVDELKASGKEVVPPKIIHQTEPEFPEKLRRKKITGTVVISFVLDESGVPRDLKVKSSSNHGFDAASLEAARQWRFEPARVDGQVAAVASTIEFSFRLY